MVKENVIIKKDTKANWNKAKNFIPKEGDIIVYTDTGQFKIGNGKDKINYLPFLTNYEYTVNQDVLSIEKGGK